MLPVLPGPQRRSAASFPFQSLSPRQLPPLPGLPAGPAALPRRLPPPPGQRRPPSAPLAAGFSSGLTSTPPALRRSGAASACAATWLPDPLPRRFGARRAFEQPASRMLRRDSGQVGYEGVGRLGFAEGTTHAPSARLRRALCARSVPGAKPAGAACACSAPPPSPIVRPRTLSAAPANAGRGCAPARRPQSGRGGAGALRSGSR